MKPVYMILIVYFFTWPAFCQQQKTVYLNNNVKIIQLTPSVYQAITCLNLPDYGKVGANNIIVATDSGAVFVNVTWNDSLAATVDRFIKDSLQLKTLAAIVTHSHVDCAGGMPYLVKNNIPVYGLELTDSLLELQQKDRLSLTFTDSINLNLGNINFMCYFPGAAHAPDNIVVWIPVEGVLFGGCIVKDIQTSNLGNIADADIRNWPIVLEKLKHRYPDAEWVVPGHGESGNIQLLEHTLELLSETTLK